MKKQKIVFILPSLKAGGAERVLSFLSCSLNKELFSPQLLVIGFEKDSAYAYPEDVTLFLNKKRSRQAFFDIIIFLIKHKPNIAMSSIGQLNILLGVLGFFFNKTKFVGRIASVTSVRSSYANKRSNWFLGKLNSIAHKNLDRIICQSEDMSKDLQVNLKISEKRITLINNPITSIPKQIKTTAHNRKKVQFITVGRLTEVKGHERLLHHLSKINAYEFEYTIVGSGHLEEQLKGLVNELELHNKINFISYSSNVYELLVQHDIFLQGSFVEGFPNAALESCVVGVPVLAYNVPGGTKEIVKSGLNGFLVNTEEEFQDILNNPNLLMDIDAQKISKDTKERFSAEKILKQYEAVFLELIK